MLPVIQYTTKWGRFEVLYARPRTKNELPIFEPLLICNQCQNAYLGKSQMTSSVCKNCNAKLQHPNNNAMQMCDMAGKKRKRITSDEEERSRRGYIIESFYQKG